MAAALAAGQLEVFGNKCEFKHAQAPAAAPAAAERLCSVTVVGPEERLFKFA